MDLFSFNAGISNLQAAIDHYKLSHDAFLLLFNNSPVCMSMTTQERVYVKVNRQFVEKLGYTEKEVVGRRSFDVGILDAAESQKVGAIIREKGRLQNDYVLCRHKNGQPVHTVSSIEHMVIDGQTYLVSFFVDVTKMVEQQAIIEKHAEQLQLLNADLESFSYSISHDLRAPLRSIDGYARILEEDYNALFDDEGRRVLGIVQGNARRMGRLIDDLLAFSRLGRKEIVKTMIDMNQLVGEVIADLTADGSCKATISVADLHPLSGDHSLIKQVMVNLVSNAIKYSSKKEDPQVHIASEIKDNRVVYTVRDNGEGFDMQYIGKLFGVFQRLHANNEFEGTGVGLAIVKRIVNRHGGTVSAVGEPGKGASFSVALPL